MVGLMELKGDLFRPRTGQDSSYGKTQTYELIAGGTRCSLQPASWPTRQLYAQRNVFITSQIYLESDNGAQVNDKFVIVDENGFAHVLLVEGMNRHLTGRLPVPLIMDATEIQ